MYYRLFKDDAAEELFWTTCFKSFFDDFRDYDIAEINDDMYFGVDVWVNRKKKIRLGVQLKTQSRENVNLPFAYQCKGKKQIAIGIHTYINSNKLDYIVIAYPSSGKCYMLDKASLKQFWNLYETELKTNHARVSQEKNGECEKHYFSIALADFLKLCNNGKIAYNYQKIK